MAIAVLAYLVMLRPHPSQTPRAPRAATSPAPPWTPRERERAVAALRDAFAGSIGSGSRYSLVVLDAQGRTLYDACGACSVIPASVQKLIVADAALQTFGPYHRSHTILAARSGADQNGTIDGDLWLVGSGDPSLRFRDLEQGAESLRRQGVRAISGGVVVDTSAIAGPEINPRWDPSDAGEDFQTATSAATLDGDTVEFRVYGNAPGTPARVAVVPPGGNVHVTGEIVTSSSADDVVIAPLAARNTFALGGAIPAGAEEKFWLPIHGIARYTGDVLDAALHAAGITVGTGPTVDRAPLESVVLWDHASPALRQLIAHMLYFSDNHYAEQLMRMLGPEAGLAADDAGGIAAERAFLQARNIPIDGVVLYDGSGLAQANRVSALVLARVLSDADLHGDGYALYPLLPAGGRDGTLKHYDFTTALGRVRAKTGHLSDAASLAGYLDTHGHGRITFAFMINDSPGDPDAAYVRALDRLAEF